jgi:hypothetical protein
MAIKDKKAKAIFFPILYRMHDNVYIIFEFGLLSNIAN